MTIAKQLLERQNNISQSENRRLIDQLTRLAGRYHRAEGLEQKVDLSTKITLVGIAIHLNDIHLKKQLNKAIANIA